MLCVVRVRPWWDAQYVIPVFGMLLGSTVSGVSIGLNSAVDNVVGGKERIEALLAFGASRQEAVPDVVQVRAD